MTPEVEQLSGDLRAMLQRESVVDPRSRPIRFHNLKAAGSCAAHYLESFQSEGEQSLAQRLGSGTHAFVTGQPVVLFDQPAKKGEGKAPRHGKAWDQFQAERPGATILIRSEFTEAVRMATAIRQHDRAAALLYASDAVFEQTVLWTQQGRTRRSTPDIAGNDWIGEIKTTRCAKPEVFRWDVRRFSYHAQLADQSAAFEAQRGRKPREAFIIAVEKRRPHVVQVFRLTPNDLEQGARLCRAWFEAAKVAEESSCYDGYHAGAIDLDLPMDEDVELTFGDDGADEAEDSEP